MGAIFFTHPTPLPPLLTEYIGMTPDSQALSLLAESSSSPTRSLPRDAPLVRSYEELVRVAAEAASARTELSKASEALMRVQGVARGAAAAPHAVWSDLTALASARSPPPHTAGSPRRLSGTSRGTTASLARAPGVAHMGAMGGETLRPTLTGTTSVKQSGLGIGSRFSTAAAPAKPTTASPSHPIVPLLPFLPSSSPSSSHPHHHHQQHYDTTSHHHQQHNNYNNNNKIDAAAQWSAWVSNFTAMNGSADPGAEFSDDE